jgi:two-component system sensor histidine kinase KdpD
MGLGLAICRAIAQAHGGDIQAVARPGHGARLEFTLPTTEPHA